jgi:methylated-DNA-[protein]-cysteine S-methyltransferase
LGPWVFDTAIGRCGIWWSVRGITRVALPEVTGEDPGVEPPPDVQSAIKRMTALLRGEQADLTDLPLDLHGVPEFHRRVYDLARRIPPGQTRTYGDIANELGDPGSARAVGQALGRNPFPIVVPCHRVLAAGGRTGGFSAPGGVETKMRLLEIEGASVTRTLPFD